MKSNTNKCGKLILGSTLAKLIGSLGWLAVIFFLPVAHSWGQRNQIQVLDLEIDHVGDDVEFVVVDREEGVYLGHPTTCLLDDQKTILCVYPQGHGRGKIIYKRSQDGGATWSKRLKTPENWETSKETPTLHLVRDAVGKQRIIMFSGLYPIRMSVSEDEGDTWSSLKPVGEFGGIVAMSSVFPVANRDGKYMAMFHDDGRFESTGLKQKSPIEFSLFKTVSDNGGISWSHPEVVWRGSEMHLCEPGVVRSPDGRQLACLLRENTRRHASQVIFSNDEGETWSDPKALPKWLWGDRHVGKYLDDGRLIISFRCNWPNDERHDFQGDWVAWIGTYEDLCKGWAGDCFVRIQDNTEAADCAYPGVELLPDGTIVTTTYGHWEAGKSPFILTARIDPKVFGKRN